MSIIPYQEPPGNYNLLSVLSRVSLNYTIPRTTGELQLYDRKGELMNHYTIPRTTGELQHGRAPVK